MDDDLPLRAALIAGSAVLKNLTHEDLSVFSVEDLRERVACLEREMARTQQFLDKKASGRSAADALFSFKGS
jgi:uncharacterized small protein (DUF1192 family)